MPSTVAHYRDLTLGRVASFKTVRPINMDEGAYMTTQQLEITVSDHQPAVVVALRGELDIASGDTLRRAIRHLVRQGRVKIVADASGLRFCDSCGLEALLDAQDEIEKAAGSMRLTGVHGILKIVLEATRLRDTFVIDGTPVEAVAAMVVAGSHDVSMV
ncbi:STAS domain-containing protein [Microbispora bryophytorum]|nr:STAS domain-containing protein [Microbispora bryophytorum]MBD3138703.1 STAS domain-containing protein [Microbispora bryophytorum]